MGEGWSLAAAVGFGAAGDERTLTRVCFDLLVFFAAHSFDCMALKSSTPQSSWWPEAAAGDAGAAAA